MMARGPIKKTEFLDGRIILHGRNDELEQLDGTNCRVHIDRIDDAVQIAFYPDEEQMKARFVVTVRNEWGLLKVSAQEEL